MSSQGLGITIGGLLVGFGLFFAIFKAVKSLKRYRVKGLIYVLLMAILLSLSGLLYLFNEQLSETFIFILGQIFCLLFGILNVSLLRKTFPGFFAQPFGVLILFNVCIIIISMVLFNIIFEFLTSPSIKYSQFFALLWFLVPLLLAQTIQALLDIPDKYYKAWYYPLFQEITEPTDEELLEPLVISFIFNKNRNTKEFTTFRARAPINMPVGKLFCYFLIDYNDRNPESEIDFLDHENIPAGWVFFKDKKGFFGTRKVVDTDVSVKGNQIRENDILICKRMPRQQKPEPVKDAKKDVKPTS